MNRSDGPDDETAIRLYVRARRVACRVAGEDEAPDIAGDVMVRLLSRWETVASYADRWVTVVAANAAIDTLRRRPAPTTLPLAVPFEEAVDSRLVVGGLLGHLSRRQRQVVVLHHLVGLDYGEVGEALGIGVASVKTHLARAMAALRAQIEREAGFNVA